MIFRLYSVLPQRIPMNWLSLLLKNIKKPAMPRLPPLKAAASLILALLPCLALIWIWWWGPGWHYYYQKNYRAGDEVLAQARTFLSVPPPKGEDRHGNLQLPLLNPLREAT
ncbi:hypothetical protein B5C26_22830, partial [Photorhabdus luminescens]